MISSTAARTQARHLDSDTRRIQALMAVADYEPITTPEIARRMKVNRVTALGYLHKLQASGQIRRVGRWDWETTK